MRKLGSLGVAGVIAVAMLLAADSALAIHIKPPAISQIGQATVAKPNGIAYDPYSDDIWVSSAGSPPGIDIFHGQASHPYKGVALPSDSEPGAIAWGPDDYVYVIDNAKKRVFKICPDCGSVDVITDPASVNFLTDYVNGYRAGPMLLDFGNSFGAGSIWFGPGFGMSLMMPDTITPNGGDILPDIAKPRKGRIVDQILIADAENNHLVRVSDTLPPTVIGTIGGLPGTGIFQVIRDVDVNPLNLNPNVTAPAIHPVFIANPQLGGIFMSLSPSGPWSEVPGTGVGQPAQVASDCDTLGATSFGQNLVTWWRIDPPKDSHCEDFVELLLSPKSGAPLTFAGQLKAYVDGGGQLEAIFGKAAKQSASAIAAKKGKRLSLTAGKLTKFKLPLPSGLAAALRSNHKAVFTVKIHVTSPTGRSATVARHVRIKR
jgi:hypothetical protein